MTTHSFSDVERTISGCYPHYPSVSELASTHSTALVSRILASRLNQEDITWITGQLGKGHDWKLRIKGERETLLVNAAAALSAITAAKVGLPQQVPPAHIHRMQTEDPLWRGDLYSANMVAEALENAGLPLIDGQGTILDFGCSSGSLLRVMAAAFPATHWHGQDPVAASVEWARENVTNATFSRSPLVPPLKLADYSMDGAMAVSIWSHYGQQAAKDWFLEMARIIKPGGFLLLTYHGVYSLLWMCRNCLASPAHIKSLFDELCASGHAFRAHKLEKDLDYSEHWGQAYMTVEWLRTATMHEWTIDYLAVGRNQFNQDVAVLRRTR